MKECNVCEDRYKCEFHMKDYPGSGDLWRAVRYCDVKNKLKNGMWDYKLEKPKESKAYLVMFQGVCKDNGWFEVVHYQAKCQKWKRLDNMVVGWSELPNNDI